MPSFYGNSSGAIAGRDAFNAQRRLQEEKNDRARERAARDDEIETNRVTNEQIRRIAASRGDADLATNRATTATQDEVARSAGIQGRADRSRAGRGIAEDAARLSELPSETEAAISGNNADTATNRQTERSAASKGRADRAENRNAAAEANRKTNTVGIREEADKYEAQARQRKTELESVIASEALDSGEVEIEAQTRFADAMNDFLGSFYETALRDGPRAADLINDFDLNNDGNPDIVGAVDVVIEDGTISIIGENGKPVIDGSTGQPAVYQEEEYKKALTDGRKANSKNSSSTRDTRDSIEKDRNKYSKGVRDAARESVLGRLGIDDEVETVTPEAQDEIDLVAGAMDQAMAGSDGLTLNQALDKFGSPAKILRYAGFTQRQLTAAAEALGVSETQVLRDVLRRKNRE